MDMGRLLEVLVKRWKAALLVPLAAGLVVGAACELLPSRYEASRVIRLRSSSLDEASFDREFTSLYQYGKSPQVARRVIERTGAGQYRTPTSVGDMLEAVTVAVPSGGDTLIVSARSQDPIAACRMADAWVEEVVILASGGGGADGSGQALDEAIEKARQDLDKSLEAYQQALRRGQSAHLQSARDQLDNAIVTMAGAKQQRLGGALQERLRLERDAAAASGLAMQLESGGEGAVASSWPALVDLKLGVYGSEVALPREEAGGRPGLVAYQIDGAPPSVTAAAMAQDVWALWSEIGSRLGQSDAHLSESVPMPLDGWAPEEEPQTESYWVDADALLIDMVERLGELDARLVEEETALASARLEYGQALGALESVLAQQSRYQQEDLSRRMQYEMGPAAVARKESTHTLRNTMLAVLSGALIGVCLALLTEYWQYWRESSGPAPAGAVDSE